MTDILDQLDAGNYSLVITLTKSFSLRQQLYAYMHISHVLKSSIFENGNYQLGNLPKDQELEKVIWPNIALSMRTGSHTLS